MTVSGEQVSANSVSVVVVIQRIHHSFLSELEKEFYSYWNSSYLNKRSKSDEASSSSPG